MTAFNPQIQNVPIPDYTSASRPISQPEADKSKGIMLSTVAEGIDSATSLAERTAQDYLKEKVRAGVDVVRGKATLDYENILAGKATPEVITSGGYTASLVSSDTDVPEALESGIDRATNLALGRSQSRMNDTLYTAQLNSLAKQLRSEYPGHRDFIDEQIAKISGKNPANAYMENLIQDINRSASSQDFFRKMILKKAEANLGENSVQLAITAFRAGRPGAFEKLTDAVFKAEENKAQYEAWSRNNTQTKGDQAADADLAKSQYQARTHSIISDSINPVLETANLTTPAMINKLIEDSQAGKIALNPEQHTALLNAAIMYRNKAATRMDDEANNGGFARRIRNPAEVQAIREYSLGYLDRMIDSIKNKEYGTLFEYQRKLRASQDITNMQADSGPMGEWLRRRGTLAEKLGPAWTNYIDSLGLQRGNLKDVQDFVNNATMRAGVADDIRKDGVVKSLYSDLETVKKAKANGHNVPDKAYDDLINNVDLILKAKETGREDIAREVVKYMFDPDKNKNIMTFFDRDFGQSKGRFAVNDILNGPKVIDAINGLSDRASWDMFKSFQRVSFKTLFGEEVKELAKIDQQVTVRQGPDMKMVADKNLMINWNSDTNRIEPVILNKPRGVTDEVFLRDPANASMRAVVNSVHQLNRGIANIAYAASKDGTDPTEAVFDTLMELGYSPNDRLHGNNLPQKVIEAIKMSQEKPKTAEERLKETYEKVGR